MHSNWRDIVIKEAMTWKGTPYHHRAFVKGTGCDCGTFLHMCFKLVLNLPPFKKSYAMDWATHNEDELYLDGLENFVQEVKTPKPGDVVIWKYGKAFSHGTIVISRGKYIHSWGMNGTKGVRIDAENFFHLNLFQPGVRYRRPRKMFTVKEELLTC